MGPNESRTHKLEAAHLLGGAPSIDVAAELLAQLADARRNTLADVIAWLRAEANCDAPGGPYDACKHGHEAAGIFAEALEGGALDRALSADNGEKV